MGGKKDETYQIATRNLGLVEIGSGIDGFQVSVSGTENTNVSSRKKNGEFCS